MRYTADIRRYLEENPNKFVDIVTLRGLTYPTLHEKQVQNAINRIKQQMKNEDTFDELQTVSRGEVWRYVPHDSNPERVTVKLTEAENPQELDRQNEMVSVPETEPLAQFKVIGSLYDRNTTAFKGTVVQAASEGFSGTYLLTSL